jgi:phage terminase large subunit GpA-like protein
MSKKKLGSDWLADAIGEITEQLHRLKPSDFNEKYRYLPESVTSMPGFIRYDVNPYMREILDCFDVESPVREVSLKKGVQITYSTVLESGAFYYMAHVKTLPIMYLTADRQLATARLANNFLPMIHHSGFSHIIQSADVENSRKSGNTNKLIEFEGGGYLVPFGARNADKMRSYSICVLLKDELDAFPHAVGKDGDPDALSDDRCSGYWERRKIFRGSTPLIKGSSKIEYQFRRGDQREYRVLCRSCNFPQKLEWPQFTWDLDENGSLILNSVRFKCKECGFEHFEGDKTKLFAPEHGAHWHPTQQPIEPHIRSYHLPALYSPAGMQPWYKCVSSFLQSYDPKTKKIKDVGKYQVFYNNVLAEPFEEISSKISFVSVSAHRRFEYRFGEIPNNFAKLHAGSPILFMVCTVDVHKHDLFVLVTGFTVDCKTFVINYFKLLGGKHETAEKAAPVWSQLREFIEEKNWYSEGKKIEYSVAITLIDAGYNYDTVVSFCSDYESGVYPIVGRDRTSRNQALKEFSEFKTQLGTIGYRVLVDLYKDRLAPVLRRDWDPDKGPQKEYHFNAPSNITDKDLKELTVETRRSKTDTRGYSVYYWHRPGHAPNELWDLTCYAHAAAEIFAYTLCLKTFGLVSFDWDAFWDAAQDEKNEIIFSRKTMI